MTLYESTCYTFSIDGDTMINRWSGETAKMNFQDFKDALMNLAGYIIEHKTNKLLIDATNFQFALPPENIEWRNENFYTRITKTGTNRQALILPEEYLVYAEDEVAETDVVHTRYFAHENEATDWLAS